MLKPTTPWNDFADRHVLHSRVDARIVETHAVDDRLVVDQPEQAWLRISRLRPRRDGADFDAAESQAAQRVDGVALLVQSGGQTRPDSGISSPSPPPARRTRPSGCNEPEQAGFFGDPQGGHADVVGDFRIQTEQSGAGEGIQGIEHPPEIEPQLPHFVESLMRQSGTQPCEMCTDRAFCHSWLNKCTLLKISDL